MDDTFRMHGRRILHVIQGMDPREGGPPVSTLELAVAQARLGAHPSIIFRRRAEAEERISQLQARVNGASEVQLIPVDTTGALISRLDSRDVRRVLRSLEQEPEVMHAHGVWDPILRQVSKALGPEVIRVVATKGMLHPYCMSEGRFKKELALRSYAGDLLARSRRILGLNEEERIAIDDRFGEGRGGVFPNGINVAALPDADGNDFRAKFPQLGDRPYFVFVGRLDEIKGVDVLTEAFAQVRKANHDVELVLVGPDSGMESKVRSLAEEAGISEHVLITGAMYGLEKYDAIHGAIAFAMASRYEGWGNAVAEAMAMGVPVVVTPQCHFPRIVETGVGLVVPRTSDAFAAAMIMMLEDPARVSEMGKAARKRVVDELDWSNRAVDSARFYGLLE